MAEKHQSVQRAIEELSAALKSAKPDVVLLIGDDQEELFSMIASQPSLFFGVRELGSSGIHSQRHERTVAGCGAVGLPRGCAGSLSRPPGSGPSHR